MRDLSSKTSFVTTVYDTDPNNLDWLPLLVLIWIDDKLKFHEHTSVTIAKVNCILAIIKRSFNVNMNTS